jgi:hypothetical protein
MAFIETIKDDNGNTIADLVGCHDKYRFPDGSTMFVNTSPAWCRQCRTFVMVEELKSPDEMEANAREFAAERMKNPLLPTEIMPLSQSQQMYREMLEESLRAAQQWRLALRQRVSQPRCLECADTRFILIPRDGSWIRHPASASRQIRVETGVIRVSLSSVGRLYDSNGLCIAGG